MEEDEVDVAGRIMAEVIMEAVLISSKEWIFRPSWIACNEQTIKPVWHTSWNWPERNTEKSLNLARL